ncbi:MAG: hypothetical protein J5792_04415 [Bacteroidales bacterium]|nr:hypothetical protein [Bacteroidales bacterium]
MEFLGNVLAMVAVAVIVAFTAYIMLKLSNEKELKKIVLERKKEQVPVIMPIRLQAYERIALFLERIRPESLLLRESPAGEIVAQYHGQLLTAIRNEFEHNLSQQVYISSALWEATCLARQETVKIINLAFGQLNQDAPATQLSSKILEMAASLKQEPSDVALSLLHQEVMELY